MKKYITIGPLGQQEIRTGAVVPNGATQLSDVDYEKLRSGTHTWDGTQTIPYVAPPPTPEELAAVAAQEALIAAKAKAKADTVVQYLRERTVAECMQYVEDNVTDLASAKAFLKKVAAVMSVLCKEL